MRARVSGRGYEVGRERAYEGAGDVDASGAGACVVEPLGLLEAEESVIFHEDSDDGDVMRGGASRYDWD